MTIKDFLCIAATRFLLGVLIQPVTLLWVNAVQRHVGTPGTTWNQNITIFGWDI